MSSNKLLDRFYSAIDSTQPPPEQHKIDSPSAKRKPDLSEAIDLQVQIKSLRQQIIQNSRLSEVKITQLISENSKLKIDLQDALGRETLLQSGTSFLMVREKRNTEKLELLNNEKIDSESFNVTSKLELMSQLNKTKEELTEIIQKFEDSDRKSSRKNELLLQNNKELKRYNDKIELKLTGLNSEIDILKDKITIKDDKIGEFLNEPKIEIPQNNIDELKILRKLGADQLNEILNLNNLNSKLTSKLDFLQTIIENIELIKEERNSLTKQLSLLQTENEKLSNINFEYIQLQNENKEWKSFLNKFGEEIGIDSPYALARLASDQRFELATLKESMGFLKANEKNHLNELDNINIDFQKTKTKLNEVETGLKIVKSENTKLERLHELSLKNADMFKEILKSYDLEDICDAKTERINILESRIEELLQVLKSYHGEKIDLKSQGQTQNLIDTNQTANNNVKFDYDPEKTRVLMLNDNPASISNNSKNDLIKSLQLENDKLKSMINLPNTQAETYQLPNETFIVLQKELQNSKSEIEQLTLRLKRLKDAYSIRIQEFLKVIHEVLGYKLEIHDESVTLISNYSQKDHPSILYVFSGSEKGHVEFIGKEDGIEMFRDICKDWIELDSLPCIVSAITQGLYRKMLKKVVGV